MTTRRPAFGASALLLLAGTALSTGCATYRGVLLPPGLAGPQPIIRLEHRTTIDPQRVQLTRDYLAIHHPALAAALPPGDDAEAIRFTPRVVVVHYTAIPTLEGTLAAFAGLRIGEDRPVIRENGLLNVGIQYVVDRDGTIYSLYPPTVIARHAIGLNHVAIGIENVGDGDLGERGASAPLTEEQLAANAALIRWLALAYPTLDLIVGHQELPDVERPVHPAHPFYHEHDPAYRTDKVDPGRRFLRRLRRALHR